MTKMFLVFSHKLLKSQKEEAILRFNVEEFVKLPNSLQNKWSIISPQGDIAKGYLDGIINFVNSNKSEKNYALVEGEYGLTYAMVRWCMKNDVIPLYATTKRIYRSSYNIDGSINGTHVFKHVTFRVYKNIY